MKLRNYQEEDIAKISEAFFKRKVRRILYVSPTGSGKSCIFTYIAKKLVEKNKKILILVHRRSLMNQASKYFKGLNFGFIHPNCPYKKDADIQIAMIQTISSRIKKGKLNLECPYMVIGDEGHHYRSKQYKSVLDNFRDSYLLLVTATPQRLDGRGLGDIVDEMIVGKQTEWLIENNYLSDYDYHAPDSDICLENIDISGDDYNAESAHKEIKRAGIISDNVNNYKDLADGKPCLVFCCNVNAAKESADKFIEAGYKAIAISGKTPYHIQDKALNGLKSGEYNVVTSCDLIGEGVDVPCVAVIIIERLTKSLGNYLQWVGRGLRKEDGKDKLIIIDPVGNYVRHGLPRMDREWSLETKKKKDKFPSPRQCNKCFKVFSPGQKVECSTMDCPLIKEKDKIEKEFIHADIKKINEKEEIARMEAQQEKIKIQKERKKEVSSCKTLDELKELGKKRKYKDGWAVHVWESRGKWK